MAFSKKKIRVILGWLVAVIIIYFIGRQILTNRDELQNWNWQIDWIQAILSAMFLSAAYLCAAQAWRTIIAGFDHKIKLSEAFRVIYLANLGRYIPGKIWQVFGMVGLAGELNIPATTSLASFALVQTYMLPAGFIFMPILLGQLQAIDGIMLYRSALYIFATLVFIVFLVFFIRPGGLEWLLNKALRLFKRQPVTYRPAFGNRVAIFVWYAVTWVFFGAAFHFFIEAILEQSTIPLTYAAGIYITAYIIGYISFISPGGLGFREGVISALLAPFLGLTVAGSVALINRVYITVAEGIITLLALLTYRLKK